MPLALYVMAFATFAVGTAEFIIAGLLPTLATDLSVSIPTAGLLVSGYALSVAFGGPLLALWTAHVPRKPMVLAMIGLFALGQVVCALAPNYPVLLGARILVALTHGLFFGNATIAARALVPPAKRGAALALVLAGVPVANLLGVPVGAALGHLYGWRLSFWLIAALAALATLGVAFLVPNVRDEAETNPAPWRTQLKVLFRHQIALSYLAIAVLLAGMLAFGTFQVPFLIEVTGVAEADTPAYLFVYGIGAIAGVLLGGWLTDWKLLPSAIGTLIAFAAASAVVLLVMRSPVAMFGAVAALGIVGYAFSTPLQTRIVNFSAGATTLVASFISTAFNLGYAVGALAGAWMLAAGAGYTSLPVIGIASGLAAAAITAWSARLDRP